MKDIDWKHLHQFLQHIYHPILCLKEWSSTVETEVRINNYLSNTRLITTSFSVLNITMNACYRHLKRDDLISLMSLQAHSIIIYLI